MAKLKLKNSGRSKKIKLKPENYEYVPEQSDIDDEEETFPMLERMGTEPEELTDSVVARKYKKWLAGRK